MGDQTAALVPLPGGAVYVVVIAAAVVTVPV